MLTKLSYTYSLPAKLALQLKPSLVDSLRQLEIEQGNSQQQLSIVEGLLTLMEVNLQARSSPLLSLSQMASFNFEYLINNSHCSYNALKTGKLQERKEMLLCELVSPQQ